MEKQEKTMPGSNHLRFDLCKSPTSARAGEAKPLHRADPRGSAHWPVSEKAMQAWRLKG